MARILAVVVCWSSASLTPSLSPLFAQHAERWVSCSKSSNGFVKGSLAFLSNSAAARDVQVVPRQRSHACDCSDWPHAHADTCRLIYAHASSCRLIYAHASSCKRMQGCHVHVSVIRSLKHCAQHGHCHPCTEPAAAHNLTSQPTKEIANPVYGFARCGRQHAAWRATSPVEV